MLERFELTPDDKVVLALFDSPEPIGLRAIGSSLTAAVPRITNAVLAASLASMVDCGLLAQIEGGDEAQFRLTADGIAVVNALSRAPAAATSGRPATPAGGAAGGSLSGRATDRTADGLYGGNSPDFLRADGPGD